MDERGPEAVFVLVFVAAASVLPVAPARKLAKAGFIACSCGVNCDCWKLLAAAGSPKPFVKVGDGFRPVPGAKPNADDVPAGNCGSAALILATSVKSA